MTTKSVTIFRYIAIISILLFFSSCETDFDNIGGDLVDNNVFGTDKVNLELTAYNKNLVSSRVDNSVGELMPLGVFQSDDFGLFKSSLIAQLGMPSSDWENPILDAVYLEIPYDAKSVRESSDNKPKFELQNIIGDKNISYDLKIYRLNTFLNKLDPTDPSKNKKYYSDKIFDKSDLLYSNSAFKPNENDTIEYYHRTLITDIGGDIVAIDSIKSTGAKPFMRFALDRTKLNDIYNKTFDDINSFRELFKGIIIEANGSDGSVMMLNFSNAKINFYISSGENTEKLTEYNANADLNNDGVIDGEDVRTEYTVRKKKIITFPLFGVKTNYFDRDYSSSSAFNALTNPNTIDGEKKLFVQGAAGSVAVIDLFRNIDLDEYRAKNWLINEANLTFFIDNQNDNELPNRLLLYKTDPDTTNDINENEQLVDAIKEGNLFNGFLQKDGASEDEDSNPIKYKVNITEYITQVLKKEDFIEPSQLALKVYNTLDTPTAVEDVIVSDFSWNPKGVVLYGNDYISTDADYDKRIKLEIYYTELKN